jgi:hypothetical protein
MGNPSYSEGKAMECIANAQRVVQQGVNGVQKRDLSAEYFSAIEQAISLLVLARCQREIIQAEVKTRA